MARGADHAAVPVHRRELDGPTIWSARAIKNFPATLPGLVSSHILDGCGHWVQQERPDEVNRLLTGWLHSLGLR